jgi:LmbE family N-acetylglucosaminyl deacetylase
MLGAGFEKLAHGRIVVVSPHLDDAVLSLGAAIYQAVRAGATVEVLTIFGSRPSSGTPAASWDARSGFATEGEAALARRLEDRDACHILGAQPRCLDFAAEPYEPQANPAELLAAVRAHTVGADCVLIPGHPLSHRDHAQLSQTVLGGELSCHHLGLYAEQPYVFHGRRELQTPSRVAMSIGSLPATPLQWVHRRALGPERKIKARAVRAYRSQLQQLGLSRLGLWRMFRHEAGLGTEAIAWLS